MTKKVAFEDSDPFYPANNIGCFFAHWSQHHLESFLLKIWLPPSELTQKLIKYPNWIHLCYQEDSITSTVSLFSEELKLI